MAIISRLTRWRFLKNRKRVDHLVVTVYTREQCSCCHKALDLLKTYQEREGFRIESVDIDTDPELVARYNTSVPVVAIDGKVRFQGVVNPVLFERILTAERGAG